MKFQTILASAFIGAVAASPVTKLQARQTDESDELVNGACKDVTFIFARGSTEPGNMVSVFFYSVEHLKLT